MESERIQEGAYIVHRPAPEYHSTPTFCAYCGEQMTTGAEPMNVQSKKQNDHQDSCTATQYGRARRGLSASQDAFKKASGSIKKTTEMVENFKVIAQELKSRGLL